MKTFWRWNSGTSFAVATALAVLSPLAGAIPARAQSPAAPPASSAAKPAAPASAHPATHHKKHTAAKPDPAPAPVVEERPPDPPPPNWPVNSSAAPANVSWDGRELNITAENSSLQQILNQVSTAVGVKVEGANSDQRIFGAFGPAPARDVLSQLLDGSGYNVLMIGDQGEGTPRQLVLTAKTQGAAHPGQANGQKNEDEEAEEPEQPEPQPDPMQRRPGMPPGRNPQQMFQEMQNRRQQLPEQQQQQGTPVQPPIPPQTNPNQPN